MASSPTSERNPTCGYSCRVLLKLKLLPQHPPHSLDTFKIAPDIFANIPSMPSAMLSVWLLVGQQRGACGRVASGGLVGVVGGSTCDLHEGTKIVKPPPSSDKPIVVQQTHEGFRFQQRQTHIMCPRYPAKLQSISWHQSHPAGTPHIFVHISCARIVRMQTMYGGPLALYSQSASMCFPDSTWRGQFRFQSDSFGRDMVAIWVRLRMRGP